MSAPVSSKDARAAASKANGAAAVKAPTVPAAAPSRLGSQRFSAAGTGAGSPSGGIALPPMADARGSETDTIAPAAPISITSQTSVAAEADDVPYHYDAVPPVEADVSDDDLEELLNGAVDAGGSALDALVRSVDAAKSRDAPPPVRAELVQLPVAVDDYIRNYLVKQGLLQTLEAFELEWYSRFGAHPLENTMCVPDVYLQNAAMSDRTQELTRELSRQTAIAKRAVALWERAKKERDLHRLHHTRAEQEKGRVVRDLRRLQEHAVTMEPTVAELKKKYDEARKSRMLLQMDHDKLAARVKELEQTVKTMEAQATGGEGAASARAGARTRSTGRGTRGPASASTVAASTAPSWPADERPNPHAGQAPAKAPAAYASWGCRNTFKGHAMAATCIVAHPKKALAATSSDDGSWRLFSLPRGELICSGEGHTSWVAGIAMHPKGIMAATASGDKTVKLWDFASSECRATLKAHTDGVWCVDFQETGELLLSGALDHTTRVWDVETGKCRQTLRGHLDAVNSAVWQPFTNTCVTGSGDKTVSVWDARGNTCMQVLYGHQSTVTKVAVPSMPTGADQVLVSCDGAGVVTLWDLRTMTSRKEFKCGPHAANSVAFDRSGTLVAVASDDATIKLLNLVEDKATVLKGHEDAVQCAVFDPINNAFLISCGSDTTVRYWS